MAFFDIWEVPQDSLDQFLLFGGSWGITLAVIDSFNALTGGDILGIPTHGTPGFTRFYVLEFRYQPWHFYRFCWSKASVKE